jgi:hypothetical protein
MNNPKIIILCGKAEVGKNKSASILSNMLKEQGKKAVIIAYASYLKEYAKNILSWDGNEDTKPRSFLQNLGIDIIKNKIDDKFLINRIIEDIKVYSFFYDVIIISDARMVEEITDIKDNFNNVIVVKIVGKENSLTDEQKNHITEIALDNYEDYDFIINNTSDINNLSENLKKIVEEV